MVFQCYCNQNKPRNYIDHSLLVGHVANNNQFFSRPKLYKNITLRSSCPEVLYKEGILKNFTKFTGKHFCQSLFLSKFTDFKLRHRCFPASFAKLLRSRFHRTPSEEFFWRLRCNIRVLKATQLGENKISSAKILYKSLEMNGLNSKLKSLDIVEKFCF